jgi:hypothetical protein
MIYGTYHAVSAKHLGRYASESAYHFNTRELTDGERFEQWFERIVCRLKWFELTGAPQNNSKLLTSEAEG